MNGPTGVEILIIFLFLKYLYLGLSLMILFIKRLWIIDKFREISIVCSLIFFRCIKRIVSIEIKVRVLFLVIKKKLFKDFLKNIETHAKGNKEEFGKALVVFSGKF